MAVPSEREPSWNAVGGDPLRAALARMAPGTPLRDSLERILRGRTGALIVLGYDRTVEALCTGGFPLDVEFSATRLRELCKMDGAVVLSTDGTRILRAAVHLMPDPTIPSEETGTRHRTAERVAKQTGALVVSVSQQRETVTIFVGQARYQLDPVADVLAKTNQALGTLETYRQRLEQVLTRLTALEFQNAVVLDDVLVVLQRAEMITRMAARIMRDCVELGTEGRLIRLQLEEFVGEVPGERDAIVRDYHVLGAGDEATAALADLSGVSYQDLLEFGRLAEVLGYDRGVNPLDQAVVPRGYRVLSHLPRLPEPLVRRVVGNLGSLDAVVRASQRELESVEGVGAVRAREIREGLRRLQEHNLVDRYLQL